MMLTPAAMPKPKLRPTANPPANASISDSSLAETVTLPLAVRGDLLLRIFAEMAVLMMLTETVPPTAVPVAPPPPVATPNDAATLTICESESAVTA